MASTITYTAGFSILLVVLNKISGLTPARLLFIRKEDFKDYRDVFIKIRQMAPFLSR